MNAVQEYLKQYGITRTEDRSRILAACSSEEEKRNRFTDTQADIASKSGGLRFFIKDMEEIYQSLKFAVNPVGRFGQTKFLHLVARRSVLWPILHCGFEEPCDKKDCVMLVIPVSKEMFMERYKRMVEVNISYSYLKELEEKEEASI